MEQQKYQELKMGERGAVISIIAYICLSALKLFIGNTANSQALIADGLNNATDIIASVAVLIGLKLSQKPPDKNHPYGHWKAETVASLVASFIMMFVGVQVLYDAVISVVSGKHQSPDMISAWTGIFSAVVMYFVYIYNRNLGKKIKSQAVLAAAKDNLSDAWVSIGTTVGIVGSQLNLPWLDPLTAIIVAILICRTAWGIFQDASLHLTDGFDEELISCYKETVLSLYGVKGVKEIRGRRYGNNAVVDIVILVNSNLNIREAHDISTMVENVLRNEHEVYDIHVHVEPN
ncbi:cation diffusion facilitator family transporter [Cytobacillus sp. IB215316]|uniref:cation diffusion facilitator family transporter n=1 Tax=Cytobacillus sp. IB215316 TaxID=3097354 RepID=UPI002A1719E7|nr:cation diffusion facilitator family transporter [Cytobacillus sp. IB215316]MDX8361761.1 cation diffusion facilitator family transporter [Cytobacillus sp. IB215316]